MYYTVFYRIFKIRVFCIFGPWFRQTPPCFTEESAVRAPRTEKKMLGRGSRSGRALVALQLALAACTHCSLLLSHALHPHLPAARRAGRVLGCMYIVENKRIRGPLLNNMRKSNIFSYLSI